MSAPEVLRRITAALEQAGIAYMLTGSFASAHFGLPRSTQDIDFVIEANMEQLQLRALLLSLLQNVPAGTPRDTALRVFSKPVHDGVTSGQS